MSRWLTHITLCSMFGSFIGVIIYIVIFFLHHPPVEQILVQGFNYTQVLDHSSYSEHSRFFFQQRLFADATHWDRTNRLSPIFVYLGSQTDIQDYVRQIGVLNIAAPRMKALVVYIEHRFYGQSAPFGSIETAMADPTIRAYLTIDQVLADYVDIIVSLKANLSTPHSPVIMVGCSYGGMLAAWFRLKYSHIAMGALASSAPMFYFYSITSRPEDAYCQIVSKDFEEINNQCHDTIQLSWSLIDQIGTQLPNGLNILSDRFKTCSTLQSITELKLYIAQKYIFAAQYNGRFGHWINLICNIITNSSNGDILSRISSAVFAVDGTGTGTGTCSDITAAKSIGRQFGLDESSMLAWKWQLCTDLVIPTGCGENSMLPVNPFDFAEYTAKCQSEYGVSPHPNWIISHYGGHGLNSSLVGSNIVFSNGMRDPNTAAGVLEDISDTIIAIKTEQGSKCLDVNLEKVDDPKWLVQQREKEIQTIVQWINEALHVKEKKKG